MKPIYKVLETEIDLLNDKADAIYDDICKDRKEALAMLADSVKYYTNNEGAELITCKDDMAIVHCNRENVLIVIRIIKE